MNENCKDCIIAQNLKEVVDKLDTRVAALEVDSKTREHRLSIAEEQTKQVFEILKDIKVSIKEIAAKLSTIESKPGQRWDELIRTVLTVLVSSGITMAIAVIAVKK